MPIVYTFGIMGKGYNNALSEVINDMKEEGFQDLCYVEMTGSTGTNSSGHPDYDCFVDNVDNVIMAISDATGWETGYGKLAEYYELFNREVTVEDAQNVSNMYFDYSNLNATEKEKITAVTEQQINDLYSTYGLPCSHEWSEWDETTNPATYVGPGEATRSCTVCGEPDSKVLEQLTKIDLATEATITLSSTSVTYNGKEIKPTVTVKIGETPVAPEFYDVQYANNKNVGTATVTVTAKEGNVPVSGVIVANFVIKPAAAKTFKLSSTSVEYNGKVRTPSVTVKDANGITLKKDVDYTVKYASGRKYVGKYAIKITLKGNYTGSKTLNFTINPPKRGLSKLTAGKKKLTASWKAQKSQTTGYQLLVSSSSKFKSYKKVTVKSYKTTKTTVSKLSSKKYYYVKMRTYKKVGSTTYYSGWSSVKKVKVK